ncbi:hypothetical protein KIL84_023481 [Mauremys mutica]|uniref:HAT C-terminal dimerisation domain-containing protein n=1 Tax=Mauremys mutica TaxID=74926 RepID=A0A9D3WPV5_9SAUR|nr:hypothetical protein KIL84_023481 [Mauremys mutica]
MHFPSISLQAKSKEDEAELLKRSTTSAEADCLKPPLVTDKATSQMEITELLEDGRLKSVQKTEGTLTFWKSVPKDKYPNIRGAALKLISMFASTYLCESVFSTLKHEIQVPIRFDRQPLKRTAVCEHN